jgi:hypothetical protein
MARELGLNDGFYEEHTKIYVVETYIIYDPCELDPNQLSRYDAMASYRT